MVGAPPAVIDAEEPTTRDADPPPLQEETKTQRRIEVPRLAVEIVDEPSTRPIRVRPATFGARDYARIAVAAERGEAEGALSLYGLAAPDLPRLEQECRARSQADPGFAEAFAKAVAELRRR